MNSSALEFKNKAELDSEANLAEFIRHCREDLKWSNDDPDFDWEAPRWRGVYWTKLFVGSRNNFDESEQLDAEFVQFAKAYYRYCNSHSPTKTNNHSLKTLFRVLEASLLNITKSGAIGGLSLKVLDEAAVLIRQHYCLQYQYEIGRRLMEVATFVSKRKLVPVDVSTWKAPFQKFSTARRTGLAGLQEINRKMPSEAGMQAMAEIFANDPSEPQARFVSAFWALLMSAPWRCSELLSLHVDAEYEDYDDQGVLSYGFRYYGAKGFEHDIKWVPKVMEEVARKAFSRIREMTQPARELAAHLESTPGVPFRYSDCPAVGIHDILSLDDKAAYLRHPLPSNPTTYRSGLWKFKSIADNWEKARHLIPKDFPYFNSETGLKWSKALFAMHKHMLHSKHYTNYYRLWAPAVGTLNDLMGHNRTHKKQKDIFELLGYKEQDGTQIKLTTHQPRHFLSTVAERGLMAQDDLARYAGRTNAKHNHVYNHMTEEEKVVRTRTVAQNIQLLGAHQPSKIREPVTIRDFNLRQPGPVHKTEFGYCTHDWPMSPCDKYRDCLNCTEHVYVKGNADCHTRIKDQAELLQSQYDEALEAISREEAGADRWLEYLSKTLFPAQELLALLESDEIEDGTVIKRNPDAVRRNLSTTLRH